MSLNSRIRKIEQEEPGYFDPTEISPEDFEPGDFEDPADFDELKTHQASGMLYEAVTEDEAPASLDAFLVSKQAELPQKNENAKSGVHIVKYGTSSGILRARGYQKGMPAGSPVATDLESTGQHIIVFGGTGEGKTKNIIRPFIENMMSIPSAGLYITDGKGTLGIELEAKGVFNKRKNDVIRIGTEPGEFGVNLVEGLNSYEFRQIFTSVLTQIGGKSNDSFWDDSAATLIEYASIIANVYQNIRVLREKFVENYFCQPVSIVGYKLISKNASVMEEMMKFLEESVTAGALNAEELTLMNADNFRVANLWFAKEWLSMAQQTKSGIEANLSKAVESLTFADGIRDAFATGLGKNVISLSEALNSKIVLNNISIAKWGAAGKFVSVFLATRLKWEAQRRFQLHGEDYCKSKICVVVADEFQELVTVGAGAFSDSGFWNMARTLGVHLLCATQSKSALTKVIGEEETSNLINLCRTKIILPTEDPETHEFAVSLAGETMRKIVTEDGMFETVGMRTLAEGSVKPLISMENIRPSLVMEELRDIQKKPLASLDLRFIPQVSDFFGSKGADPSSQMSALSAAYWRQEDKEKEMKQGIEFRPLISVTDLQAGGSVAFIHYRQFGNSRMDLMYFR